MTDVLKGCTVAFARDIREDDVEAIVNAIRMIKGVLAVELIPGNAPGDWIIEQRVRREYADKVVEIFYPKT